MATLMQLSQITFAVAMPFAAAFFYGLALITGNVRFDYAAKLLLCLLVGNIIAQSGPFVWNAHMTMKKIQRSL